MRNQLLASFLTVFLATSGLLPAAGAEPAPQAVVEKIARHDAQQRRDEPGAAAAYHLLKRQSPDGGPSAQQRNRAARSHMEVMPVHSLKLGGFVPPNIPTALGGTLPHRMMKALGAWENLGPGNIGGRTRALVIRPDDPATMYAGGVSGGIWKTSDGGLNWTPIGDDLSNIAVNSMVMDPDNPLVLYAGTGEGYFREEVRGTWLPLRGSGIFRSEDGGQSWRHLESTGGEDFHWVNDLVISPHDSDRIYAATRSGVWRSTDRGATWTSILEATAKGGCLDLEDRPDTGADWLLASCGTLDQSTVFRTLDATTDEPWEAVLSEPGMARTTLAAAPSDPDIVYALAAGNSGGPGGHYDQGLHAVYRSDQGGAAGSWQTQVANTDPVKLNTLLLTNPVAASYADCGWSSSNRWINMGWYCNVIAVDPVNPDIVWAGGVDLFRSDDGGRTWGLASCWWADGYSTAYAHADQHVIAFHPDYDGVANRTMIAATDGGIFSTSDSRGDVAFGTVGICDPAAPGISWTSLNHNYGVTQFYHGAAFPDGRRFIGGTQDNGTISGFASDGTDGWYELYGGDGGYVAVDPTDTNVLYVEYQWASFQKSTNGGWSFDDATNGITAPSSNFLFITPFIMDPSDPQTLWTGGRRVWRTTDGAERWSAASSTLGSGGQVSALAVAPDDPDTVVVGTTDGAIYHSRFARTATSTTAWESTRPREGFVSWLSFDPDDSRVLWATYAGFGGSHVWQSSDFGETWVARDGTGNGALPDIPVHCIAVDPSNPYRLFVGTDLGVFTSTDMGATWAVENTGFAAAVTESLSLNETDGGLELYAFTHGRGAWRATIDPNAPGPRRPGGRAAP